jgi:hypothetical protein
MARLRDVRVVPSLAKVQTQVRRQMRALREADPDTFTESRPRRQVGDPSELGRLPGMVRYFQPLTASQAQRFFGLSLAEVRGDHYNPGGKWEPRVLPRQFVDRVHFAEVITLAALSGADVYVGDGWTLAEYRRHSFPSDQIQVAPHSHIPVASHSHGYVSDDGFELSHAPITAFPVPISTDSFALRVSLSPTAQESSLQEEWVVAHRNDGFLSPVHILGELPAPLYSAMVAHGHHPMTHVTEMIAVKGDAEGSLDVRFHDFYLRYGHHRTTTPSARRAMYVLQDHLRLTDDPQLASLRQDTDLMASLGRPVVTFENALVNARGAIQVLRDRFRERESGAARVQDQAWKHLLRDPQVQNRLRSDDRQPLLDLAAEFESSNGS